MEPGQDDHAIRLPIARLAQGTNAPLVGEYSESGALVLLFLEWKR